MHPHLWQILSNIGAGLSVAALIGVIGWRVLSKSQDPARLLVRGIITALLGGGTTWILPQFPPGWWPAIVIAPAMIIGIMWAPAVGTLMAGTITNAMDGGDVELEAQPFYSVAESKRRNGHPQEAIAAVREQLAKFPGDFRGTMLLASILAEDLNDLPGAQVALERWMDGPSSTPQGMASGLTAIADWQLQFAQDPEAARVALERIVNELPGTQIAHQAAQRLAHLPTVEHLVAMKTGAPINLRPGDKTIGLRKDYKVEAPPPPEPAALADEYVKQLEKHPTDTATREKLAVIYADHFRRLDLASDQLEQLIAFPNETARHIVGWLNLLADLQIRVGKSAGAAEATLRRIIEMYPGSSFEEQARSRIASVGGEMKASQVTAVKALGHYEKNIGLKRAVPKI